jgi:CBS domain-containing protein
MAPQGLAEEILGGELETIPPVEHFLQSERSVVLPKDSLLDASRRMVFDLVPALIVWDDGPAGVISYRDILFAATAGKDLGGTTVGDIMDGLGRPIVQAGTLITEVMGKFVDDLEIGVVVMEGGHVLGLVTMISICKGLASLRESESAPDEGD